jgi:hypothetical protein
MPSCGSIGRSCEVQRPLTARRLAVVIVTGSGSQRTCRVKRSRAPFVTVPKCVSVEATRREATLRARALHRLVKAVHAGALDSAAAQEKLNQHLTELIAALDCLPNDERSPSCLVLA